MMDFAVVHIKRRGSPSGKLRTGERAPHSRYYGLGQQVG